MRTLAEGGIEGRVPEVEARPRDTTVAVVHDYLTQRGGAERVVLSMLRAFPDASLHTSIYAADRTFTEFRDHKVRVSPLARVPGLRRDHRLGLALYAPTFNRMHVEADVVLCSSSGWAHGVRTMGRKVVYCHAPARWLYQPDRYLGDGSRLVRLGLGRLTPALRRWDQAAAGTADRYLANSRAVQRHIAEVYGIEAEVLSPPHAVDVAGPQRPIEGVDGGFLLCVARLLPYKNVDVVLEALRARPDDRLVVVGDGPELRRLVAAAPTNVTFAGRVDDATLRWAYVNCRALVAASYEDFGLTPLEAAAFGRPTVALRAGGYLDTVREGVTGLFFDQPAAGELVAALTELDRSPLRMLDLVAQAAAFDEASFGARLRAIVEEERASCR